MTSLIKLLTLFSFLIMCALSVKAADGENLSAKITTCDIKFKETTKSEVILIFQVKITLTNDGDLPLFLLKEESYPHFLGTALADSSDNIKSRKFLAFDYFGPSVDTSEKWTNLATKIDTSVPTFDNFYIVAPKNSLEFNHEFEVGFLREKSRNFFSRETVSWNEIKDSVVWLKIFGDSWSDNLDKVDKDLGKRLQSKWKKRGNLWIDGIETEPIQIDLKDIQNQWEARHQK